MQPATGKLIGIALRSHSRAVMQELEVAEITAEHGVQDDSRGRPGARQVTLMSGEDWRAACDTLGQELPWTCRRANLLVDGIALRESTGSVVRIDQVELQVTGETDPCSRMDEIAPGLQAALKPGWRGGVCCRVLRGGSIATGMPVTIHEPTE